MMRRRRRRRHHQGQTMTSEWLNQHWYHTHKHTHTLVLVAWLLINSQVSSITRVSGTAWRCERLDTSPSCIHEGTRVMPPTPSSTSNKEVRSAVPNIFSQLVFGRGCGGGVGASGLGNHWIIFHIMKLQMPQIMSTKNLLLPKMWEYLIFKFQLQFFSELYFKSTVNGKISHKMLTIISLHYWVELI